VDFYADYEEIKFQKNQLRRHFSDVIIITSPKSVTQITTQFFSILPPPPQSKFLATPVVAAVRSSAQSGIA